LESYKSIQSDAVDLDSGWLISEDGKHRYPIRGGIPRFVPDSNYADNFGMQWNHFAKTQLDSHSGHPISTERFWKATGWRPEDLRGKWVLDVGCGSGRFAEVALAAGAQVVALDYSSAVDACYANFKQHADLHVVQGDIYALPFAAESFPFVYSLGVLQHTPDVARAFAALPPMLAPGGRLCVDYYEKSFKSALLPKYWLRPITKRLPKPQLFALLERLMPVMLPISRALARVPVVGKLLKRLVPVVNYDGIYPLTEPQLLEWGLLDTFDMLAPTYDQPQTAATVRRWLKEAGLCDIEVLKAGHLVGRGRK
jgi:2-polyprenyl-3-methyl-5-hydroxy-6-metoxy-1,4-benzoquinol methylase